MKFYIDSDAQSMGLRAAEETAHRIQTSIEARDTCRLLLSTGASQFEMFDALTKIDLPWEKVEMFHLDEYVNLPYSHPASFRKYLTERFIEKVHPGAWHFVNGEGNVKANIEELTHELRKSPIDVALIGIGENGHIAFNDPPADFTTQESYIVVDLDERCKRQQMGEGWFATLDDVPKQAVSMTVWQMMQSRVVLSVVPGTRKSEAVRLTLESPEITNRVPATKLREHEDWTLFLDAGSASQLSPETLSKKAE